MKLQHPLYELLQALAALARECVSQSLRTATAGERSQVLAHAGSDVIFAIDREVERGVVRLLEAQAEAVGGVVLVAEGIGENERSIYPKGRAAGDCRWRMLMDPIDGTRGIMMDKRSAWFIAAVAPNLNEDTWLRHVEISILAELPHSRAGFADVFCAVKGQGVEALRKALLTDQKDMRLAVEPYAGNSIRGGFAQLVRFFPGGRVETAILEEALWARLFPDAEAGEVLGYEDQYICTGGQWVELMTGRDRFCADLRPLLFDSKLFAGKRRGFSCHPYDMAGLLVAEEAGIVITDVDGAPLDAPFDTLTECNWIGYANEEIRRQVEPVLHDLLREQGWFSSST
ncbi:hypothetical protein P3T73_05680 [Kiritimatiellota bacterium B12222]|nr:hypothetical protein P3T73_05680 [Kiritimatiellota bacterium B12222]